MQYIYNTNDYMILEPSIVSLGKFDGLHIGHNLLIEQLKKGKQEGLKTIVVTFDLPPQAKGNNYKVLTTSEEKMHVFEQAGVDVLIELPFTDELRHQSPKDFLVDLQKKTNFKKIVCGTDFHFGYKRSGDEATLRMFQEELGYKAVIVDKLQYENEDISSTRIRESISNAKVELATRLLGYPYFVSGKVVKGQQLGRTIQIPTANLIPDSIKLLPPYGVYVTQIDIEGNTFYGVTNVGKKPTVGDFSAGVETFIFDYNKDIYDKDIKVSFLHFIRLEQRFSSIDELVDEMNKNIAQARKYIEENGLQ